MPKKSLHCAAVFKALHVYNVDSYGYFIYDKFGIFIDRVAGEIIRFVRVCACVSVLLSVGTLLSEPFDL